MKKINIVKEKKDFDRVFKCNKQTTSKYAYLYTYDNESKYRFGICISKKLGNAVLRNKLKRRIKDIIDKSRLHFLSKDYIIVLKKGASIISYNELRDDIIFLLKKSKEIGEDITK